MIKKSVFGIVLIMSLLAVALMAGFTAPPRTHGAAIDEPSKVNGKAALLLDCDTGTVVYEQNKDARLQIASMVKIMTLNLLYEDIDAGRLSLSDEVTASANATSMGGSQAFLDTNSRYKAGELIKSIIVASANDSCVAMAEHVSGSVEAFVNRMNDKAATLGMTNTYFVNCTGLPAPNQYSCAADVATMSRVLFARPGFFEFSREWMYDFVHPSGRVTGLTNTNKLTRFYEGCDGGKTGFTSEALSCLSATAKRGATRLVAVVVGAPDAKTRNAEIAKLFNYGFSNYECAAVINEGDAVEGSATVKNGKTTQVGGRTAESVSLFGKKGLCGQIKKEVQFFELSAPVKCGDAIGELKIYKNDELVRTVGILANDSVDKLTYGDIVKKLTKAW